MRDGNFQERFGVNVSVGIGGNKIIESILLQVHLPGVRFSSSSFNEIGSFTSNLLHKYKFILRIHFSFCN